ncbi:MAG: hypothetical protein HKL99_03805, partial [Burkholderiales bacterium]|nr:hypothetical protein [Burkholderiales bacterium]
GGAFQASGAGTVIGLGWGGLAFAFLAIVFGAVSLGARSRTAGVLLTLSALGGAMLGGTLVAVCMVLALVGGILASLGTKPAPRTGATLDRPGVATPPRGKRGRVLGGIAVAGVFVMVAIGLATTSGHGPSDGVAQVTPARRAASAPGLQSALQSGPQSGSQPASLPAAKASAPQEFKVGEAFESATFRVNVTSAAVVHSVGDFLTSTAPAGAEYVALTWRTTNRSQAPVSAFSVPSVHLLDPLGHRYDADLDASALFAEQIKATAKAISSVNPGITLTDGDVFEVSTARFNPATWTIVVRLGGQDVRVRFPAMPAERAPAPVQPVAQAAASAALGPAEAATAAGMVPAAVAASRPAIGMSGPAVGQ